MTAPLDELLRWLAVRYADIGLQVHTEVAEDSSILWLRHEDSHAELLDRQLGIWIMFSVIGDEPEAGLTIGKDVRRAIDSLSRLDSRSGVSQSESDELGAWQVHVCWLITSKKLDAWEVAMRDLRRKSSYPEEIGMDRIDATVVSVFDSLQVQGIPCLLFNARRTLGFTEEQMPAWRSPDANMDEAIAKYVLSIQDDQQREFSSQVIRDLADSGQRLPNPPQVSRFSSISLTNFRNIANVELSLDFSGVATVVHGPNGTGKSSLFEAISISLFGTSKRHREYLADPDLLPRQKSQYTANALVRRGAGAEGNADLSILLDGKPVTLNLLPTKEDADNRLVLASGTVLAQESAREFVLLEASDVAARVLGDYSPRARQIQQGLAQGLAQAKDEWMRWLRSLGLNASLTKQETILRRLVAASISKNTPPFSQSISSWLVSLSKRIPRLDSQAISLRSKIHDLDSPDGRESITNAVASAIEKGRSPADVLREWLLRRDDLLNDFQALTEETNKVLEPLRESWSEVREDVTKWATWSNRRSPALAEQANNSHLVNREGELRKEMADLAPVGQLLRAQKEHLDGVVRSLIPMWSKIHPHDCPTCATKHEQGIDEVIRAISGAVSIDYENVRSKYASIQTELKLIQSQSVVADGAPITDGRMEQLSTLLLYERTGPNSLEALVSSGGWQSMLSLTESVMSLPAAPAKATLESIRTVANAMATDVLMQRTRSNKMQELPLRWEQLKRKIDEIAMEVVSNHLPATAGSLWREIALALTSARWNHIADPRMQLDVDRHGEKVSVVLGDGTGSIAVRHILNQAEQHILGLAWFFVKHLTSGRFTIPLVMLDDPAQEMDQVTYRTFTRFIQSFCRLHRAVGQELSVLVMLHQEERALDLARAAAKDGNLTVLEWAKEVRTTGADSTVRQVILRNKEQRAPLPPAFRKVTPELA